MRNNKLISIMKTALTELAPTENKAILISDIGNYNNTQKSINIIEVSKHLSIQDVLVLIGDARHIGILNPNKISQFTVSELMSFLPNKNETTIVVVKDSPVSCKIIHPEPKIGTKHVNGNYEYRYGQEFPNEQHNPEKWDSISGQKGWGIRVIDNTQTDYMSPLTIIQGYPVTNMTNLFHYSPATTLNLINWDTSMITDMNNMFQDNKAATINGLYNFNTKNVTTMRAMFYGCKATSLVGLDNIDTSAVTDMSLMFYNSNFRQLDLRNFDTANVTNMDNMFARSQADIIDLSNFDTSRVTNMEAMFHSSKASTLDISKFNTSSTSNLRNMFACSQTTSLDLRSFDIANVVNINEVFGENNFERVTVRNQSDALKIRQSTCFFQDIEIVIMS